jgi:hypothetical protein
VDALVLTPPTQPAKTKDTATRLSMNTRSVPRFERGKFNADSSLQIRFFIPTLPDQG